MAETDTLPPTKKKRFGATNTLLLPISGDKVTVRRPSMFSLVASGGLPGELTTLVWKLFGEKKLTLATVLEDGQDVKNFALLVEKFLPHVLVDPKIADVSDCEVNGDGLLSGAIALMDISDIDKNHLFLYGVGVLRGIDEPEVIAADLATFREESERNNDGHDGTTVRTKTKRTRGDGSDGSVSV